METVPNLAILRSCGVAAVWLFCNLTTIKMDRFLVKQSCKLDEWKRSVVENEENKDSLDATESQYEDASEGKSGQAADARATRKNPYKMSTGNLKRKKKRKINF